MSRTGGQVLVDQLRIHGADTAFTVPGESFLHALDALHEVRDEIRLVTARHEAGAANMAEAYGKLTGRPGICFVNRGPGATHASVGMHTAYQDSTPLVMFMGQATRRFLGREAFQEVDVTDFFAEMTKWSATVDDPERLPELVSRAFHIALSGRPGPVALALPEDVLSAVVDVPDADPHRIGRAHPAPAALAEMRDLLASAQRPIAVVGGGGWTRETMHDLTAFFEANRIPVAASFRCQDYVDNRSPSYVGYLGLGLRAALRQAFDEADLVLAVGARLGEASTNGYTLVEAPRPRQTLIHVHAGPEELGSVFMADLPILSGYPEFASAAAGLEPVDGDAWTSWASDLRDAYVADLNPVPAPGDLNVAEVIRHVSTSTPDDAITTNGAGNFTVWAHRYMEYSHFRSQLGPTSGAMGYGIPAAVAAKVVHPDRVVVCFAGDGDALMSIQELAVAVQHDLDLVLVIVNNSMLATIRMHQERTFPGRVHGTELVNPDFAALARSFGAHGELVTRSEDFPGAFARALDQTGPSVIELRVDPEQLTPTATLSGTREAALSREIT